MDDSTAARLALLETHVDWLYQNSGYAPPTAMAGRLPPAPPRARVVAEGSRRPCWPW